MAVGGDYGPNRGAGRRWTARGYSLVGASRKTVAGSARWQSYCMSAPPPTGVFHFSHLSFLKEYFNGLRVCRIAGIYSGRRRYYSSAAAVCAPLLLNKHSYVELYRNEQ
jgi:hypothetical protein